METGFDDTGIRILRGALTEAEIDRRVAYTRDVLYKSGAHYVIDSIVELPEVIDDINLRLARGEKP